LPAPRLIRLGDVPPTRWRNGGGVTRELLAAPSAEDWTWRVSVADVEADGPFSAFAGVERWFAVLDGAGVELDVDGLLHRLGPGDPALQFDGGAATRCRLIDGPTRDFNLMLRGARGRLQPVHDRAMWHTDSISGGLFSLRAGDCVCNGVAHAMPALALLWFDSAPDRLSFEAAADSTTASAAEPAAATLGWWIGVTPGRTSA
jgi:environmental stress-induced protein Ves